MSEVELQYSGEHIVQMLITLPEQALEEPMQAFLKEKRKHAVIKGFRKGKAPLNMIAKMYSHEARTAATDRMLQTKYFRTLQEHKLRALTQPTVHSVTDEGQSIKCSLTVEVLKPIVLQQYLGLELTKQKQDAIEPLLEKNVARLKTMTPKLTPADAQVRAESNNVLDIDFVGEVDGNVFEDTKNYKLRLGSNMFIDGFEEQLIGTTVGETKIIKVTFPQDYQTVQLAGKEATFTVKINQINVVSDPNNEELAQGLGLESYDKVIEKLTSEIQEKQNDEARLELENQILETLVASHDFSVPLRLVTAEVSHVKQQNPLLSEEETLATSQKYVKTDIILNAIYERHPEIHLNQEYINDKVVKLAAKSGKSVVNVIEELTNKGLMEQYVNFLKNSRIVDFVIEMADVKEVEKKEEENKDEAKES